MPYGPGAEDFVLALDKKQTSRLRAHEMSPLLDHALCQVGDVDFIQHGESIHSIICGRGRNPTLCTRAKSRPCTEV